MLAIVVLVVIASSPKVFAQKELSRGHVGGSIAGATTDEAERMRLARSVRIARNFSIAATGRYYFLRRGGNTPSAPTDPRRWQFEYRSSGRIAIGAAARATW